MTTPCPAGHTSDESDYCSVCGAAIPAVPVAAVAAAAPSRHAKPPRPIAPGASGCPVCGEPRTTADARFCEVCRYDFEARVPGPPPTAQAKPVAKPAPAPAAPAAGPAPVASKWILVLTVDASLDTEPDPATPPPPEPERIFPIEQPELLVGRRDDRQNIRPAVPLHDPGASRRHARFLLNQDGTVSLHDLGSTNGTKLNGQDVVSGSVRPLKEDDEVTMGRWTRIRLKARP